MRIRQFELPARDVELHVRHLEREGLVQLADTLEAHLAQLERSFQSTEADQQRVRAFTQLFVRPYGFDQAATPRVVRAIEEEAQRRR